MSSLFFFKFFMSILLWMISAFFQDYGTLAVIRHCGYMFSRFSSVIRPPSLMRSAVVWTSPGTFPLHFFQRLLYFSVITGGMSISSELFCFSVASWMSWQLYRSPHISSGTITNYCLFLMTLACLSLSEYMWFSTMPRRLFTAFRLPPFFTTRSMNRFILNFRISACDAFWWTLKALLFLCCRLWLRLICFAVSELNISSPSNVYQYPVQPSCPRLWLHTI